MRTTTAAVAVLALTALSGCEQPLTVAALSRPDGHIVEEFRTAVAARMEKLKARIANRGHGLLASSKLIQDIRDFVKGVISDIRSTVRDNATDFLDENLTDIEEVVIDQVQKVVDKVGLPEFLENKVVDEVKSLLDGFVEKYMDARSVTTTPAAPVSVASTEAKSDVLLKVNMVMEDHKSRLSSVLTAGSPTEIIEAFKAFLEHLLQDVREVLVEDTKEFLNEDIVEIEDWVVSSVDKVIDQYLSFLPEVLRDQVVNQLETTLDLLIEKYFPEHEGDVGPPPSPHLATALKAINSAVESRAAQLEALRSMAHKDMTPEEVEEFKKELEAFVRDTLADVKNVLTEDIKDFLTEEIPEIEEFIVDGISRILDQYCKFLPEKVQDSVVIGLQAFLDALIKGYLPTTPTDAPNPTEVPTVVPTAPARLLRGVA